MLRHLFLLLFTFVASEMNKKNERQDLESYAEDAHQQGMPTVFCIYVRMCIRVFILHVLVFGASLSEPYLVHSMAGSAVKVGDRGSR